MTAAQPYEKSIVKEPFLRLECDLGEGPYYEEITNSLRIVDIKKKQLHTVPLDDFNNYTTTQLNEPISVTADIAGIDPKRKILVALKYGLAILDREKGDYEYICQYDNFKNERLRSNDGAVDPNGRFWVGNMMDFGKGPMQPEGSLYCWDQTTSTKHLDSLTIPNGIGWSPDNKTMYFTHSSARQVFAFDYSITNSSISNQRLFYEHAGTGEPDGLRVDVNGNIWQAIYGEGRVLKLSPEGQIIGEIGLPTRHTTCVQFVGTDLFITSGQDEDGSDESKRCGGALFRINVGVEGLKPFQFRLSGIS